MQFPNLNLKTNATVCSGGKVPEDPQSTRGDEGGDPRPPRAHQPRLRQGNSHITKWFEHQNQDFF